MLPLANLDKAVGLSSKFRAMYSCSLWSGVPPVKVSRINTWVFLCPDKVQKDELPKLRQQSQGCALVSLDMYQFFKSMAVFPENDGLLYEVQRTMVQSLQFKDLTLYRSSAPPEPASGSALSTSSGVQISPSKRE
jgi:hypothetical protein